MLVQSTSLGRIICDDAKNLLKYVEPGSVDLIFTSPPYALNFKRAYGNPDPDDYLEWFELFVPSFISALKQSGSLCVNMGGAWNEGVPTRNLIHFKLPIMLVEKYKLHLALEHYWFSAAKMPSTEWTDRRKIRPKDKMEMIWWLVKDPNPFKDVHRELTGQGAKVYPERLKVPVSPHSMTKRKQEEHKTRFAPSGRFIDVERMAERNEALPSNVIDVSNASSNNYYQRQCRDHHFDQHPATFPIQLPNHFIKLLTDENDLVVDPFGGSCTLGEACESLNRRWLCMDMSLDYLKAAKLRFLNADGTLRSLGNN